MACIGIDIAKRSHVASAVDEDGGAVAESFKLDDTASGFAKLPKRIRKAGATPEGSLVGMEAAGHYRVALFDFPTSHGYEAAAINPVQTDAFRDAWTVRKVKADSLDAAMIADLVRCKRYSPSALGDEAVEELRSLARCRMSLVERSTALKNKATAILDRTLPELAGLLGGACCPTHRELPRHCATPGRVLGADVGELERVLGEASRGKCGRAEAERLEALAEASAGVGFGSKTLAFEARLSMEEPGFVQGRIEEVEGEPASLLERTRGKRLVAIPGIDVALASVIAGEIGGPDGFDDPRRLMGCAGMDPTRSESGETVKSDGRMSKRGSGALRWALVQAADCARKNDPYFGDCCDRKKGADGRRRCVALSGVAGKLMGVALAVMKEERPYGPTPPKNRRPGHLRGA